MRKFSLFVAAGLVLAATLVNADTTRTRARLISRLLPSEDVEQDVLRIAQKVTPAAGTYEPQPTPANVPPLASPSTVYAPPPAVPENAVVHAQPLAVAPAMYHNVKYRQTRKAHPCAVPMLVAVPDPCNPCCQVCVQVCVPPCAVAEIRCKCLGNGVVYDFGKYEVEIKTRGDLLVVDYDR